MLVWLLSYFCAITAEAEIKLDANQVNSIAHYRAIPLSVDNGSGESYVRHMVQDSKGYLWISGGSGVLRYDGHETRRFNLVDLPEEGDYTLSFLYLDSEQQLWVGNRGLYRFDEMNQEFVLFGDTGHLLIKSIVDDGEGNLWLAGQGDGLLKYNTAHPNQLEPVLNEHPNLPDVVNSMVFDPTSKTIWLQAFDGIFKYDPASQELTHIQTSFDGFMTTFIQRDMALDEKRRLLWVGTPNGLLRINVDDNSAKVYTANQQPNSLLVNDITVTFIDSAGNLWVGLEKEGVCLHRYQTDDFVCLRSSFDTRDKIPFATVEDIAEDNTGSLWLSMNNSGAVRITPDLEKFRSMKSEFKQDVPGYFPHSFNGIVFENGDIWIATDGGGINIFNHETGEFRNIKHEPGNANSLPSNSVISLTKDEKGFVWASMWAGGISKIDPDTMTFTNYLYDPFADENASLGGNNVFSILSDQQGGLWLSIWGRGIQYFRPNEGTFKNFFREPNIGRGLQSTNVSHLALRYNKLWITGESGFEMLDLETGEIKYLLPNDNTGFTYALVESLQEIFIGTHSGLIEYNYQTGEQRLFTTEDGLAADGVSYLYKDRNQKLWIATSNGVSVFDRRSQTFENYDQQDGLNGNKMSVHGEVFEVGDDIYLTGKLGVTIINPDDLPKKSYKSDVYITQVDYLSIIDGDNAIPHKELERSEPLSIPYTNNSLRFKFTMLNYIFPQADRFRYRLQGWQSDYTETGANSRFATYTNLDPGTYTFEVIGLSSYGVWEESGDTFEFTILPPWWRTWWAIVAFISLGIFSVYLIMRWRLSFIVEREKLLELKVVEKTEQLNTYAEDLKQASQSLSVLNTELEYRVEQRTQELQVEINERKVAESKLFYMAFHDELTDLPNRQWAMNHIEGLVETSQQDTALKFGLMFLDGDRFKHINDTHGHIMGDQLLVAVAERLKRLLGTNQHVSRLGGDEFTLIFDSVANREELIKVAETIIDAFKQSFQIQNHAIYFNVSIGVLECDHTYKTVPSVLRDADIAMYRAKESGKATYRVFDQEMRETFLEVAELEVSLRDALKNDELYLVYQPILDLRTGTISGFEALMRWNHPQKGNIPPDAFIPVAEESGLIWELGCWLLHEACRQTKSWHTLADGVTPKISVNISSIQLRNRDFLSLVDKVLAESGLGAEYLVLELTESVLIEVDDNITQLLRAFQERKIDLSIDDFGTGYSSLSYLAELLVQHIKIDRKFIHAIDDISDGSINSDALEIVKATISLGHGLQKAVTAEGIETKEQLMSLIDFGCDYAQGFYISKPLLVEKVEALFSSGATLSECGSILDTVSMLEIYQKELEGRKVRRRDIFK
jgi:diguanylate cyclase (GGDEF)-like protein